MKKTSRQFTQSRGARPDLYQQVTDKIIVAIENGTLPWRKPWRTNQRRISSHAAMPCNGTTGYLYSGVNVLLLWIAAAEKGYEANRWLTYKQTQAVGGHVRAGESALGSFGHVQHDSYLESWIKVLHEDKRAIFRASKQAREASEFLLTPLAEAEMGTTESAVAA